jgi:hypothetical protein
MNRNKHSIKSPDRKSKPRRRTRGGRKPRSLVFEQLEIRSLLSNIVVPGSDGDDPLVLETDPDNTDNLRVRSLAGSIDPVSFAKTGLTSLTIDGGGGTDSITVAEDVMLDGGALALMAESITIVADKTIEGAGEVSLIATAQAATTGDGPSATVDLQARVLVDGSITTTGSLRIEARVDNTVQLASTSSLSITATSSAVVEVGSGAVLSAGTLEIRARTDSELTATIDQATSESATINATQTTHALIAGGATLTVGSGPLSADEPASMVIEAIDASEIQTDISTGVISELTGFDVVSSSITLDRDTQARLGDGAALVTLEGPSSTASGLVKLRSQNMDGPDGGVGGVVVSKLIGAHQNKVTRDDVLATVANASLDVAGLDIAAENSTTFLAEAKIAENDVTGQTKAFLRDGYVMARL